MELELTPAEADFLRQLLSDQLSDLRMEISNTEDHDLREAMKQDEVTMKSLIGRLERREKAA